MADPCSRCGVRGDVDCPHRPGIGAAPAALSEATPPDKRRLPKPGAGLNFRRIKVTK